MTDANMRVGFPYYIGTTNWFLFHSVAQRIADLEQNVNLCNTNGITLLLNRFKNIFLSFIKSGQPCPACSEHFLSKVSNNDRFTDKVNESEGYLFYPMEWLILGANDGAFESKLASITSPKELVFFLWKLHNAVSSSVSVLSSVVRRKIMMEMERCINVRIKMSHVPTICGQFQCVTNLI